MAMLSHSIGMVPRANRAEPAIDWQRLAAAPAFAVMALLTNGGGPMICTADASLLTGMVPMYVLMTIFHAPPWLKLIADRRAVRGEFSELEG
jgi:hypothetical protein